MLEYTVGLTAAIARTVGEPLQLSGCRHPWQLMTIIMSVAITTVGCSGACDAICAPAPLTHKHICSCAHAPDIRTGSSSLTVFMELTSICLCSWCVSSCCLSSIIFDILVIPGKEKSLCCRDTWRGTETHISKSLNFNRGSLRPRANSFPPSGAPRTNE